MAPRARTALVQSLILSLEVRQNRKDGLSPRWDSALVAPVGRWIDPLPRLLLVHVDTDDAQLADVGVRKLIAGRGPSDDGRGGGGLEGVYLLAALDVVAVDAGAGALALLDVGVAAGHQVVAVVGEAEGFHGADEVRQRAAADPVLGVVQAHEGVGAARGQVLRVGRQLHRQARARVTLQRELVGGAEAVDLGPVVVVVQDRLEIRVGEDADGSVPRADVDALARPAEEDLVGLDGLLVAGYGGGLGGGEQEDVVGLCGKDYVSIRILAVSSRLRKTGRKEDSPYCQRSATRPRGPRSE